MTSALLKKQLMEVFSWLYKDKKSGKLRSKKGVAAFGLLYLVLFGGLAVIFGVLAAAVCKPLCQANLGWLYWCLMGLIALLLGVFGSVFNTYASLYQAKDNDLLLSMPIPPQKILLMRLSGVLAIGLMYEMIVLIPSIAVWFYFVPCSLLHILGTLFAAAALSALVLILSAVLGWIVALIAGRLRRKSLIVVFLSLAFVAVYYYFCFKANALLQSFLLHMQRFGTIIQSRLYPLYRFGLACEGDWRSMLLATLCIAGALLLVYLVLCRSFLRLATTNRGSVGSRRSARRMKKYSIKAALLRKELLRFVGSANYMMNCGLGILFMLIAAVGLVWKADEIRLLLTLARLRIYAPLLLAAAACLLCATNDVSAPSISLEGKNLWLLQCLPVSPQRVLLAKLKAHCLLTLLPAAIFTGAAAWVVQPSPVFALLTFLVIALFILFSASIGLALNLKMPNLNWQSEIIPIKQSASTAICLLGGWCMVAALATAYLPLHTVFSPMVYLLLVCALLAAASILLLRWLMTRGADIFEAL